MNKNEKFVIIVFTVILIFNLFIVLNVKADNFGNDDIPLDYMDFVEWNLYVDGDIRNDLIDIGYVDMDFKNKIYINFSTDHQGVYAYYELNLTYNQSVIDYYIDEYNITFNTSFFNLFYDWNDMSYIPSITYKTGIHDDKMYWQFGKQLPNGLSISYDPILGIDDEGCGSYTIENKFTGIRRTFTAGSGYQFDNITVYIGDDTGDTTSLKAYCCLYLDDNSLFAQTEIHNRDWSDTFSWVPFNFTTPPTPVNNTNYTIVVISESHGGSDISTKYCSGASDTRYWDTWTYNDVACDPWAPATTGSQNVSIYVSYSVVSTGCTDGCVFTLNSTANNSVNIEDCNTLNWTIDMEDICAGNLSSVNISVDALSLYNNDSGVNGTYHLNITGMDCNTQYQVNVSANCNGTVENRFYYFTTEACCSVTFQNENISNQTSMCINPSQINFSSWINSSCDNNITSVNFSLWQTGNYSNQTDISEGLIYANFTGLSLSVGSTYNWSIVVNESDGCNWVLYNRSYWFTISDCNISVGGETPVNQSSVDNSTTSVWNITINESCGRTFDWNISTSLNTYNESTGDVNGSYEVNLTGLQCNQNITVWLNISTTQGSCTYNYTYWFTTNVCGNNCPTLSSFTILNQSCCNALNGTWNVTVNDLDADVTNGTIFFNDGQNMSWSNQANGTRSLSYVNLSCNQNITVWLNLSDGQGCTINNTYWFQTTSCPLGDCENCFNDTNFTDALENWLQNNGYIKESDTVEINLGIYMIGWLMIAFLWVMILWREDYFSSVFAMFGTVLSLAMGIYYLDNTVNSVAWWLGIIVFLNMLVMGMMIIYYAIPLRYRSRKPY